MVEQGPLGRGEIADLGRHRLLQRRSRRPAAVSSAWPCGVRVTRRTRLSAGSDTRVTRPSRDAANQYLLRQVHEDGYPGVRTSHGGQAFEELFTDDVTSPTTPNLVKPSGGTAGPDEMLAASRAGARLLAAQRYDVHHAA